jgi:hypothetical protein
VTGRFNKLWRNNLAIKRNCSNRWGKMKWHSLKSAATLPKNELIKCGYRKNPPHAFGVFGYFFTSFCFLYLSIIFYYLFTPLRFDRRLRIDLREIRTVKIWSSATSAIVIRSWLRQSISSPPLNLIYLILTHRKMSAKIPSLLLNNGCKMPSIGFGTANVSYK